MRRYAGKVLNAFPDYAGIVFIASILLLMAGGALYAGYYGPQEDDVPLALAGMFLLGMIFVLVSFIAAAREADHAWPTIPLLGFVYLFFLALLLVATRRIDDISWLPTAPLPLLAALRWAVSGFALVVGAVLVIGARCGWLWSRTNPWPFGWLWKLIRRRDREE